MIKRCDWLLQYCSGQPHSYLSMSLRGDWVTPISFKSGQTQEWSRLKDERGLWRVLKWLNLMRSKVIKNHVTRSDSHPPQGEFLKWHKLEDNDLIYHVKITCEAKKKERYHPFGVGGWKTLGGWTLKRDQSRSSEPSLNYLGPLFQSESWCSTFHVNTSFHSNVNEN